MKSWRAAFFPACPPSGSVTRTARSVLNLGTLIHFVTYLTLESDEQQYSGPLDTAAPPHPRPGFPAPHGKHARPAGRLAFTSPLSASLRRPVRVSGRWRLFLPGRHPLPVLAGAEARTLHRGGVVASSTLTHEWRELKLKREYGQAQFPPSMTVPPDASSLNGRTLFLRPADGKRVKLTPSPVSSTPFLPSSRRSTARRPCMH